MEQGRSLSLRTKPQVKDISESLGKVPPQAIDMEESVLAALLLESGKRPGNEKNAIDRVAHFLKDDHFYSEPHREIYFAIISLYREKEPIDMRTVVNRLKKTGKLEMVGGHFYVAELTTHASSSENIEAHARVIVEMSIKRQLIQFASVIHHNAFEDTTDGLKLLDKAFEDISFFKDNAVTKNDKAKIEALWNERSVTTKPEVPPPLVFIDQTPIISPGDHTLLIGKKKSRKSLLLTRFIRDYFKNKVAKASKVLLFDTEQSRFHVWRTRERIQQMTGNAINCYYLRGLPPQERRQFIELTLEHLKTPLDFIIIDGIRDLMSNINDPDESTNLIFWIEDLTLRYNIGIVNVLHINKTDNNARGHIGTELTNKTIATIEVEYDTKTGYSVCKCESAREAPFTSFSFTHSPEGMYEEMGMPTSGGTVIAPQEKTKRLDAIFADGPIKYKELVEEVKAEFAVGRQRAEVLIKDFIRAGVIIKSGKPRDPNTIYKLISSNGHYSEPPPAQTEIIVTPEEEPTDLPF